MAVFIRVVLTVVLLLILVFALYPKNGGFTLAKRIIVGILMLLLISVITFYETGYTKRSRLNRELLNAFNQNKTLICGKHEITFTDFIFVGGTQVFTYKDRGEIIVPIDNCKVK
jgi:hypothetical protein